MWTELLGILLFLVLYIFLFALEPWTEDLPARDRRESWIHLAMGGGS